MRVAQCRQGRSAYGSDRATGPRPDTRHGSEAGSRQRQACDMTGNGSGPDTVATVFEALVSDLLGGKIDHKDSSTNGHTQAKPGNGQAEFYVASDIKSKRRRRTKAA